MNYIISSCYEIFIVGTCHVIVEMHVVRYLFDAPTDFSISLRFSIQFHDFFSLLFALNNISVIITFPKTKEVIISESKVILTEMRHYFRSPMYTVSEEKYK